MVSLEPRLSDALATPAPVPSAPPPRHLPCTPSPTQLLDDLNKPSGLVDAVDKVALDFVYLGAGAFVARLVVLSSAARNKQS